MREDKLQYPGYAVHPPCIEGKGIWTLLTNKTALRALNVEVGSAEWAACTDRLQYRSGSSYEKYKQLIEESPELEILIYSGTSDMAVPTEGNITTTYNSLGNEN